MRCPLLENAVAPTTIVKTTSTVVTMVSIYRCFTITLLLVAIMNCIFCFCERSEISKNICLSEDHGGEGNRRRAATTINSAFWVRRVRSTSHYQLTTTTNIYILESNGSALPEYFNYLRWFEYLHALTRAPHFERKTKFI